MQSKQKPGRDTMQAFTLEQSIIEGKSQLKELFEIVEKMAVNYDACG